VVLRWRHRTLPSKAGVRPESFGGDTILKLVVREWTADASSLRLLNRSREYEPPQSISGNTTEEGRQEIPAGPATLFGVSDAYCGRTASAWGPLAPGPMSNTTR
jgi:hypothetical protein